MICLCKQFACIECFNVIRNNLFQWSIHWCKWPVSKPMRIKTNIYLGVEWPWSIASCSNWFSRVDSCIIKSASKHGPTDKSDELQSPNIPTFRPGITGFITSFGSTVTLSLVVTDSPASSWRQRGDFSNPNVANFVLSSNPVRSGSVKTYPKLGA